MHSRTGRQVHEVSDAFRFPSRGDHKGFSRPAAPRKDRDNQVYDRDRHSPHPTAFAIPEPQDGHSQGNFDTGGYFDGPYLTVAIAYDKS
jgi:hypothetical protein